MPRFDDLRVLFVGVGSIGRRHATNVLTLGVREVALCDPDDGAVMPPSLEDLPRFSSLDEGLTWGPNVVFVTTPSHLHLDVALRAANAGCDLFIEKPVAHATDGLAELLRVAARRHLVTMVGCNMRFHPGPALVKRLLGEMAVGSPIAGRIYTGSYLPSWRPNTDYRQGYSASAERGGGALLDCIHEIDLALWFFGSASLRAAVIQPARTIGLTVDGLAELLLVHAGGVVSSVHLNFVEREYRRGCQIIGSEGTIAWDFSEPVVTVHRGGGVAPERLSLDPELQVNQLYVDELTHFLEHVESREATCAPLEAGAAALRIAEAARAAGNWVPN